MPMFILIILHLLHAASGELFVNTKIGNDNSLGTQSDPYLTIQHACNIADVSSSTTIYLLKTDKNNIHSSYTNGDLCVQNLLTGGSFEEDGTHHWNLLNSEIQTDIIHVGTKALRLPVVAPYSSPNVAICFNSLSFNNSIGKRGSTPERVSYILDAP